MGARALVGEDGEHDVRQVLLRDQHHLLAHGRELDLPYQLHHPAEDLLAALYPTEPVRPIHHVQRPHLLHFLERATVESAVVHV